MEDSLAVQVLDEVVVSTSFCDQALDHFYRNHGISKIQAKALFCVLRNEKQGITLSQLGEKLFVTKSNITALVDRMEAAGLVERVPHSTDRRCLLLRSTAKGREVSETVMPDLVKFTEKIFSCLTKAEMEATRDIFQKLKLYVINNCQNLQEDWENEQS